MNLSNPSLLSLTSRKMQLLFAGIAGVCLALILTNTPLVVSLSFLTMACSLWLMQKAVGVFNLRYLTIPGFVYLFYLVQILIPSFFVYAEKHDPFRITFLFAVESALVTIPLGVLLVNRFFRYQRSETASYFRSPMPETPSEPGPEVYSLFLLVAWVLTVFYVIEVRTIPLFYMLAHPGEYEYISRLREESIKLLDSPLRYGYVVLANCLYPFLITIGLGRYLQTKRLSWGILFFAGLASGVLYEGFTAAKSPVASLLLILWLYVYLVRGGRVGTKFVVVCLVTVFAFPFFVTVELFPQTDTLIQLESIATRVFYIPAEVVYYYFEVFPQVVPHQYGRTIGKVANLLGEQPFNSENVVGRYMRPYETYTISANGAFLGNLNADFGIPGVLIGGFLVGVIMQVLQVLVVRRGKSVLTLAVYANLLHTFHLLDSTSLPTVLLSQGTFFILLFAWAMTFFDSMIRSALRLHRQPRPSAHPGWAGSGVQLPLGGISTPVQGPKPTSAHLQRPSIRS